jgi:hypothetical protein
MESQEVNQEKRCKDKVKDAFKSRYADIMALYQADCDGKEEGLEDLGTIFEYGLSFDYVAPHTFRDQRVGYFRYQISWGGPSEEFRIYTNPDFTPYKIEFWYLDWFDGAPYKLTGKRFEKFYDFFMSFFVEVGSAEHALKEATQDM